MKAVLRIFWTLFTAFPIQRGFGVAGLIVLAIGSFVALANALADSKAFFGFSISLLGFALVVVPAGFAAGATLRALSVPSTHALLPRFRVRVLLAVALFVGSIALAWYGLAMAFEAAGRPIGGEVGVVYAVGALTAVVLSLFVITSNPNWSWLSLPAMFAFTQWMEVDGPRRLAAAGYSLSWIVSIASAGAWLVFAIWYLRGPRVRPVLLLAPERGWSEMYWRQAIRPAKYWPAELTRNRAMSTLLGGRLQRTFPQQLLIAASVGVILCLLAPLLRYLPGQRPTTPPFTGFLYAFYATLFVAFGANLIVRQSRHAWLRVPGSRVQVFRLIERMIARLYARVVACITALLVASLWVLDTPLNEAAWGFALMSSAALYSACLGLAAVRTVWLIAAGLIAAFPMQVGVLAVISQPQPPGVAQLTAAVALQLVGAGFFRALAERRWRSIDWLKFRPLRIGRNAIHSGTRA